MNDSNVTAVVDCMAFFTAFRCEMSFETERERRLKNNYFACVKASLSRQNMQSGLDLFITKSTNKDV